MNGYVYFLSKYLSCRDGRARGDAGAVASHFFPNVMLKQAYKMLYFYFKASHL